MVEEVKMAN
jgi:hypothetical protein